MYLKRFTRTHPSQMFDAEKSIGIIWKKSTEELREDLREFLDRGKGNFTNF